LLYLPLSAFGFASFVSAIHPTSGLARKYSLQTLCCYVTNITTLESEQLTT
jgi:hypothetical protein